MPLISAILTSAGTAGDASLVAASAILTDSFSGRRVLAEAE
jgi:hypothetical protein